MERLGRRCAGDCGGIRPQRRRLIGAVLVQVPGEQVRRDLLAGLAASLATDGRESVLGVEHFERTGDDRRRELARQARVIGSGITNLAEQTTVPVGGVVLRSNCEGHVWTPAAAAHLTGTPHAPVVMQLYNEWLHQLVLLRDALLPFRNWEQVRLRVDEHGLRRIEDPRRAFLADYLTRSPRHDAVVRFAASSVSEVRIPQRAYGFRVEDGMALSSVVTGSPLHSPRGLLDWSDAADGEPTAFVPASMTTWQSLLPTRRDPNGRGGWSTCSWRRTTVPGAHD